MAQKSIVTIIYDTFNKPVVQATAKLNIGIDTWIGRLTDDTGTAELVVDESLQNTQFEVTHSGYVPFSVSINLGLVGNLQIRVGYPPDLNRPEDIILPALLPITSSDSSDSSTLSKLVMRDKDFIDDVGKRISLNGIDQFQALRRMIDGIDLQPQVDESLSFGFNMWRVFGMGSIAQNGMLQLNPNTEPYYWDALGALNNLLEQNGIVLLFTTYLDNQDLKVGYDFWNEVNSFFSDRPLVLVSGGNEWSKNGFDPGLLIPPNNGNLWSRGSDVGDAAPYRPYGSFAEFHPRRDLPAALMDTVASPVFIYGKNQLSGPLIIDEPPRMGWDGSGQEYADPFMCYKFARHYATECAGAVFHNRNSQSGNLMDLLTRQCAEGWCDGMLL